MTEQVGIRAHVYVKRPDQDIAADDLLPRELDGWRFDVLESKPRRHALPAEYSTRRDPLQGGIACQNVRTQKPGTLGAIVYDKATSRALGLSCRHVLRPPLAFHDPASQGVVQPPVGGSGEIVGAAMAGRHSLELDAALMDFQPGRAVDDKLLGSAVQLRAFAEPYLGEILEKVGARTGPTRGMVDGISELQCTLVPMPGEVAEISAPGDSGAIWYDVDTADAVGLHFRGETGANMERAWAKRMVRVAEALSITPLPS